MFSHTLIVSVGSVIGFLSGLFGVGGSSLATPLLRLLDVPQLLALASPLPVTLPTAIVGGITYWRHGLIRWRIVFWTAVAGIPSVIVGAYGTMFVPGRMLMALTGLVVIAIGIRVLWTPPQPHGSSLSCSSGRISMTGAVVGGLSGLLANGGGVFLMPAYLLLCRLSPIEAAATSLTAVALFAIPGTWVHWQLGHIDTSLAVWMTLGVIPTTWLGARVGLRLRHKEKETRRLFGWFLLVFGLLFCLRTLYRVEVFGWWN